MDPATLVGLLCAFGAVIAMLILEGSNVSAVMLPAPMILVLGATVAVGVASATLPDAISAVKSLPKAFMGKTRPLETVIAELVEIAETARSKGLLALEQTAEELSDPFMKDALQNIADGTDAEELRVLLEDGIASKSKADRVAYRFYTTMGGYSPTIGVIGTVLSLTHVLENLSTPATLGHSIAAAFVATLWGLLSANFIWLPIGTKLSRLSELEVDQMVIVMEGALAIQAGSQPRLLQERLSAMVRRPATKAAPAPAAVAA